MPKPRKYKKPHQYCLSLSVPKEQKIDKNLPHIVFHDGVWKLFRNRWKSQFRYKAPWLAYCKHGETIPELKCVLARSYDKASFGYYLRPRR